MRTCLRSFWILLFSLLSSLTAQALPLTAGDIVVYGGGALTKVDPATGTTTTISSGGMLASGFGGVVFDANGQIIVATGSGRQLVRVNPADGSQVLVSQFTSTATPFGLAIEANGSLIVTDFNNGGQVIRVNPSNGNQSLVSTAGTLNTGVAVAPNGDLIVADFRSFNQPDGQVLRVDPVTGQSTIITVGGSLHQPELVELDSNGLLLVASLGSFNSGVLDGKLIGVDTATGAQEVLASDLESPNDVAIDEDGNWIISEFAGRVVRIDHQTKVKTVLTSSLAGASGLAIVPSSTVPEPASALLVLLALSVAGRRRGAPKR